MKQTLITVSIVCVLALVTGCKKHDKPCHGTGSCSNIMQVVKDCTGSYLRYQQKDYHVCNYSLLDGYADGDQVVAGFNKLSGCSTTPQIVCQMLHANEGYVEVVCIRPAME